jgi:hypothetical protein
MLRIRKSGGLAGRLAVVAAALNRIGNVFGGNPNRQQQVYIAAQQRIQAAAGRSPRLPRPSGTPGACSTGCSAFEHAGSAPARSRVPARRSL